MARDNSPWERQRKQLERKQARRASHDRILVVCEGSKTEPKYFEEIRAFHRLQTASVMVRASELGTAPMQVVQHAQALFERGDPHRHLLPRAFEQVYAVFDRDEHDSYDRALDLARELDGRLRNDEKRPVSFRSVASIPCFEIWLLLHFQPVHAPLERDEVLRLLQRVCPRYRKGADGVFEMTRPGLGAAMERAQELRTHHTPRTAPEPYTDVSDLVSLLTGLQA